MDLTPANDSRHQELRPIVIGTLVFMAFALGSIWGLLLLAASEV
ncbi:hypothetical protein [Gluconacetobacter azotocaptans]|nr:hypothetical protein [Gluconacetobacter azotocaptans]